MQYAHPPKALNNELYIIGCDFFFVLVVILLCVTFFVLPRSSVYLTPTNSTMDVHDVRIVILNITDESTVILHHLKKRPEEDTDITKLNTKKENESRKRRPEKEKLIYINKMSITNVFFLRNAAAFVGLLLLLLSSFSMLIHLLFFIFTLLVLTMLVRAYSFHPIQIVSTKERINNLN